MQEEITFAGVTYVSSRKAAEASALSRDYVARLCKKGVVEARRIGTTWYVEAGSLTAFLRAQEHAREHRRKNLIRERAQEYTRSSSGNGEPVSRFFRQESVLASDSFRNTMKKEPIRETHERMRDAFDKSSQVTSDAVFGASQVLPPGVTHAVLQNTPAQAFAHIPVHVVTPALDLAHRLLALVTVFVLVVGVLSLFDNSQTHFVLSSVKETGAFVASSVRSVDLSSVTGGIDRVTESVTSLAENPKVAFIAVQKKTLALAASGERRALDVITSVSSDSLKSHMTAAAANFTAPAETVAAASPVQAVQVTEPLPGSKLAAAASLSGDVYTADKGATTTVSAFGSIATAVKFDGPAVAYGDLVAYDPVTNTYALAAGSDIGKIFGVVVEQPALLFKTESDANVPVIRSGSALVNVTLENGPIRVGDPLTASSIPGKAKLANAGETVVGLASESFDGASGVLLKAPDGTEVRSGTIPAAIDVGGGSKGSSLAGDSQCSSLLCRVLGGINPDLVRAFARYLLSGLIAVVSLVFSFRSFVSDVNYGVISMGRNPRAKTSIQSMVFFNALLAMVIAGVGLFASIFVLLATA